ncbi:hypothetical protein [Lacibacter sediminis]|uniref:Uncharacterized protein n=1 Tax=Lacibacter sediminis TaxID=2760713 RepID=A0A7G5XCW1_9BACT|nr:hypothetical protein [Lacibacter sediminis]QNA43314.1 hypothetical protein H4075_14655 [Lacibacter sediminis]
MTYKLNIGTIISWIFGVIVFAIGIVNTFWGNDTAFGIFILLLSFVYFLPANELLKKITGFSIPKMGLIKIGLGFFVIWASLGVGELFDKVELMLKSF